ncbi:hypothetical protein H7849_19920 [Alloacidobacterium dinghuense]|uniref:Uncharacterized protein n=1 Tax=Alloacidobacterium dinghuense TaxID=2763107 RepID=A0A7G8BFL0_9BACT|nr:hypothetical protein [Alloacidobacterium dinghuense]QNI31330.1 hypothetical protein H7849_19920 [Alloacidobacterium dinghuense]
MRDSERWIIGGLLAVALLTFFFPLVSLQIPIAGNIEASGYDVLSKATTLSQTIATLSSQSHMDARSASSGVVPRAPHAENALSLPFSVQVLPLFPIEILIGLGCALLGLMFCVGGFDSSFVKICLTLGGAAAVVAILHMVVADSDLHTWFQERMLSDSSSPTNDSFAGLAQGFAAIVSNSVHIKPGAGLYVMATSLSLAAVISLSKVLSNTTSAEFESEPNFDEGDGSGRLFAFFALVALVVIAAVLVLRHKPIKDQRGAVAVQPRTLQPRTFGNVPNPREPSANLNQSSIIPNGLPPAGYVPNPDHERSRIAEVLTDLSARQGHNHFYTVCRPDTLCITDQDAPGDNFIENFSANTGIAARLFNAGFRSLEVSNSNYVWEAEVTAAGLIPLASKNAPEIDQSQ